MKKSFQIGDARTGMPYNDASSFILFLFVFPIFFCSNFMNNAFLAPVKLPSSMIYLLFLCCALNLADMLCQYVSNFYCNSMWSLKSVKLFYYAVMMSRRGA